MSGRDGGAGLRAWGRDLALGARFATSGGRQGWTRTLLTGVGVALGVAMLLLAAAVPALVQGQLARSDARSGAYESREVTVERSERTVLSKDANNRYHGRQLYGRLLQADGSRPVNPPGLERIPASGELAVSPALKRLLDSPQGAELRERLDGKVTATIGDAGLLGPAELAFYKGADDLSVSEGAVRVGTFGAPREQEPLPAVLVLLIVVACTVLVMPVAIFVATAARFGGEQRDARLAALRLVGADAATARRIAAGEALVGALVGLVLGGWFFLLGRMFLGRVQLFELSVFPEDVTPGLGLGLLILLGVPLTAVVATIFALRGVAIEPLGLVRKGTQRRRRLWWRLVPPAGGAALLLPLGGALASGGGEGSAEANGTVDEFSVTAGVVLLLSGIVLLLPWVVERLVGLMRGGPVAWQLAVRRLQLPGGMGNATRAVSGITVAVAGAIALQMLFSAAEQELRQDGPSRSEQNSVEIYGPQATLADTGKLNATMERALGVRESRGWLQAWQPLAKAPKKGGGAESHEEPGVNISVADCGTLRRLAEVGDCRDGDSFIVPPGKKTEPVPSTSVPKRGMKLLLDDAAPKTAKEKNIWRVPESARTAPGVEGPDGLARVGLLLTPSVLPEHRLADPSFTGWARTTGDAEAVEELRTAVFHVDPSYTLWEELGEQQFGELATIRNGVLAASVGLLLLIAASMAVSMLEQLRERKRQLSVLVAFGTKRSTLGASVLWQTTIVVTLGIGLAAAFGLGLGWTLLRMIGGPGTQRFSADWYVVAPAAGAGLGVIALVTLVSLPFLWRTMRPDGLRTE